MTVRTAKYPRRTIALGPPFDDGTVPGEAAAEPLTDDELEALREAAYDGSVWVGPVIDREMMRRLLATLDAARAERDRDAVANGDDGLREAIEALEMPDRKALFDPSDRYATGYIVAINQVLALLPEATSE